MNILDYLKKPEGKTLEFKRDLSSPKGILKSIVAFANTSGGMLIIGVEDDSRHICGVPEPLKQEERLSNLVSDCIAPRILADIELFAWRGVQLLIVQIYPSNTRPHYLTMAGIEKSAYVRIGSSNRRADHSLIEEMRRFVQSQSFDEQPLPQLTETDLDFDLITKHFKEKRSITKKDLATLRLLTPYQTKQVPTIGGLLLFGLHPREYFPDAWIQAGRFEGKNRAKIIDAIEIHEDLITSINRAIEFIQKHSMKSFEIGAVLREEKWTFPANAIREIIINSVVHADYSQQGAPIRISFFDDRLEIENPGLLFFGLTIGDIKSGISKLRNRVIARIFKELGLIESWGSGIQRALTSCLEAGLPEPLFEEIGTRFRVTIFTHKNKTEVTDNIDKKILDALAEKGLMTKEIAECISLSARATRTRLKALIGKGLIVEIGSSEKDPKKRYFLCK